MDKCLFVWNFYYLQLQPTDVSCTLQFCNSALYPQNCKLIGWSKWHLLCHLFENKALAKFTFWQHYTKSWNLCTFSATSGGGLFNIFWAIYVWSKGRVAERNGNWDFDERFVLQTQKNKKLRTDQMKLRESRGLTHNNLSTDLVKILPFKYVHQPKPIIFNSWAKGDRFRGDNCTVEGCLSPLVIMAKRGWQFHFMGFCATLKKIRRAMIDFFKILKAALFNPHLSLHGPQGMSL